MEVKNSREKNEQLNKKKSNSLFENINCKYILILILEVLKKNKILKIIKYNKKLQNRVDLTINDYIEYSKIKIEIIPAPGVFGKFININNGEEK